MHMQYVLNYTVNLEIFARVIFSRNFACANFRENKTLAKSLPFSDAGKSCFSRDILTSQVCLLELFAKIKSSRKFPKLQ